MSNDTNVPHTCTGTDLRGRIQSLVSAGGFVVLSGQAAEVKTHLAKVSLNEAFYIDCESARPPLPNLAGYNSLIFDKVKNVTRFVVNMIFDASHAGMGIVVICEPGHEHIVNRTLLDALQVLAKKKPIMRLELVSQSGDSYSVLAKLFTPSLMQDRQDDSRTLRALMIDDQH